MFHWFYAPLRGEAQAARDGFRRGRAL
jgi:hypothetical protein